MKKKIKYILILIWSLSHAIPCNSQEYFPQKISKNDMTVNWVQKEERVFFEMHAPTTGWLAIGFNACESIAGAYLLMGRVVKGKVEVLQHFTSSPGNYSPITELGGKPTVHDISGKQEGRQTTIKFSLPIHAVSKFERSLIAGQDIIMILAYSRDVDFQHHSMMRTSQKITL